MHMSVHIVYLNVLLLPFAVHLSQDDAWIQNYVYCIASGLYYFP